MNIETITHSIKWFNRTPGTMAKDVAQDLVPEQGYITVVTRRAKKGGISGSKPVRSVFYFHDGVSKKRRETKEHSRNGICPHCGFFSVNQDIYVATGVHPEAGRDTSPDDAEVRAIIARFGYTYACAQCIRDRGWTRVKDIRKDIWDAPWRGYCDEDNPKHWHQVEPLPVAYVLEDHLTIHVVIDTYWSRVEIFRKDEEETHGDVTTEPGDLEGPKRAL